MKKKAREKKTVITRPEDFLDIVLYRYPKEYDAGYEFAKDVISIMERESKKTKPYSVEAISYWLNLIAFADMALQEILYHEPVEI